MSKKLIETQETKESHFAPRASGRIDRTEYGVTVHGRTIIDYDKLKQADPELYHQVLNDEMANHKLSNTLKIATTMDAYEAIRAIDKCRGGDDGVSTWLDDWKIEEFKDALHLTAATKSLQGAQYLSRAGIVVDVATGDATEADALNEAYRQLELKTYEYRQQKQEDRAAQEEAMTGPSRAIAIAATIIGVIALAGSVWSMVISGVQLFSLYGLILGLLILAAGVLPLIARRKGLSTLELLDDVFYWFMWWR